MVGFQNANYWSSAVAALPGASECLPHQDLISSIKRVAVQFPDCQPAQDWCERHSLKETSERTFFESRAVHELCADVLKNQQQSNLPDDPLKYNYQAFAEKVAEEEMRVLLRHSLINGGIQGCETKT
mmetsp:Transcript_29696/g.62060  ORF Transcript_29696/g.62060 Transcript_29696/m.62060 type:complete len:127 (-) Transcript_29696:1185-1565(-)|eukprot:CAMPEP_0172466180 /NCGR_PEP_ID=MMETSP1065-20121228/55437_1 /TAXON_ID=265537 /ORGANISM="Amphiprora paludosa, Strain CCMP125" /LENGTH=126 /DNA_ID=CAMNT_0013222913 /DNA_START=611 /DNA_END=991 /DNA_ORIENTATION=+